MFRRITIYVTLICFIICVQGCYSKYAIPTEELQQEPEWGNVTIKTVDGEVYEFDSIYVYDDSIEGYVDDSVLANIELEDIESVHVRSFDAAKTGGYTLCIVVGIPFALLTVLALYCAVFGCHVGPLYQ